MKLLPMSLVENQSVSSMCSLQCQRVIWALTKGNLSLFFSSLHIPSSPSTPFLLFPLLLPFSSITASPSFISSSVPLLKPQIISCNHPSLPSHTHTRDAALLLTTAGDHLTRARMWESVCVLYCFSLRGVISLPLRAFHLSGSFLKLFLLVWPSLRRRAETRFSFSPFAAVQVCNKERKIQTSSYHLIAHSSVLAFQHFLLSICTKELLSLRASKRPLFAVFTLIYLLLKEFLIV